MGHMIGNCGNCGKRSMHLTRTLCGTCYNQPSIKEKFPPLAQNGRKRNQCLVIGVPKIPQPKEPTNARPGSPDKIAVLQMRLANMEPLFHPEDERLDNGQ